MSRCIVRRHAPLAAALTLLPLCSAALIARSEPGVRMAGRGPVVAHHQHLISPAFAPIVQHPPIDAKALLHMMDVADTRRAVVLSMAYSFADERKRLDDPESLVRRENDWTAGQVAVAPDRLVGFCSVNPLTPGAITEVERCSRLPGMVGLKLHFGNSGVSLRDHDGRIRMRRVFATADRLRLPIVVHLRSRSGTAYGAVDARLFIDELLPQARHVTVQVAHLAGAGPGHAPDADAALTVFIDAIRKRDPRLQRVIFDTTTVASRDASPADRALVARRIRALGIGRVVFGSDLPIGGNPDLAASWQLFTATIPLSRREFARIAANVAPYLRSRPLARPDRKALDAPK